MPISISQLAREIDPRRTSLLLGAGSSIPSGAPTGIELASFLVKETKLSNAEGMSLPDTATLIELKFGRDRLVELVRKKIYPLSPSGGIIDLPLYNWKDIYTTNFDNIIEKCFANRNVEYVTISANYDFSKIDDIKKNIFKIHGTIDKDVVDSSFSRLILTNGDYANSEGYREDIYNRLLAAGATANLLVIGHSLSDPDLNEIIQEAVRRRQRSGSVGRVFALAFEPDENRALIIEDRGVRVAFGSIDSLLAELAEAPATIALSPSGQDAVASVPGLSSTVTAVAHSLEYGRSDPHRMFYGSPATYRDISLGLTFDRDLSNILEHKLRVDRAPVAVLLGVAGVGKTTLVRQTLGRLVSHGIECWEHVDGTNLSSDRWLRVEKQLRQAQKRGVLFVDDAHRYIAELGRLADGLAATNESALSLVCCSAHANWNHRTKSDGLSGPGTYHELKKLTSPELDRLVDLFDRDMRVAALADKDFKGFSRFEKKRRLSDRCAADFFVCLKNIFSNEIIDVIILTEYNDLPVDKQKIYRYLSALEASGVLVHRQHILRALAIDANRVPNILEEFDDMINETTYDADRGIYVWEGRHRVVSEIIRKNKYADPASYLELLNTFIDMVNPTYEIERHNLMEICDRDAIGRVPSKDTQNVLFRKIISRSPDLRVPRHRLIANLVDGGDYEQASNEIRIFLEDIGEDGPVARLRALISLRRAQHAKGLAAEDRINLIGEGVSLLASAVKRYKNDRRLFESYCEAGFQAVKAGAGWAALDDAIVAFETRAISSGDPEFVRSMNRMKIRAAHAQSGRN